MPKAFPLEFRRDLVAVARKRDATPTQIAKDSGSPRRVCIVGSSWPISRMVSLPVSPLRRRRRCASCVNAIGCSRRRTRFCGVQRSSLGSRSQNDVSADLRSCW